MLTSEGVAGCRKRVASADKPLNIQPPLPYNSPNLWQLKRDAPVIVPALERLLVIRSHQRGYERSIGISLKKTHLLITLDSRRRAIDTEFPGRWSGTPQIGGRWFDRFSIPGGRGVLHNAIWASFFRGTTRTGARMDFCKYLGAAAAGLDCAPSQMFGGVAVIS
jgi:hypothetical protein